MYVTGTALCVAAATLLSLSAAPAHAAPRDLARHVNPFVGTQSGAPDFGTGGGAGATFPGAVTPFGMVQFSPDTDPSTDNYAGGYSYGDERLKGFGLTHFSGAGCAIYQDLPLLPTTDPITEAPSRRSTSDIPERYVPRFDHGRESASPGSYRVTLDPGTAEAIRAELTATTRTGAARLTYPRTAGASVLINAGGSAMANADAQVAIDPARREVSGMVESGRFCYQRSSYRVYFSARFNRPFAAFGTWRDQELRPGSRESSDHSDAAFNYQPVPGGPKQLPGNPSGTAQAGAYVSFDARRRRGVQARVGISFVSVDGARRNLRAESSGRSFNGLRRKARSAWNRALGRARVAGGRSGDLRTFYTALYHSLLHPNVFSDAGGTYMGMDGAVHRARGFTKHANVSGWDTYRTQAPLVALLFPRRAGQMVASLLADARESGCLPKWGHAASHTNVMVGDPADLLIAGAHALGARRFDRAEALRAMLRGASSECRSANGDYVQREGLDDYLRQGYIGQEKNGDALAHTFDSDTPWGAAATTLEYAAADFGIARFARRLSDHGTADQMLRRSQNWRRLFDSSSGHVKPRLSQPVGLFQPLYDPAGEQGFVEGNGAQYSWFVPFDPAGLIEALGGAERSASRLDEFFAHLNAGPHEPHAFLGNEPTLHTPYLYAWLGRPWRTQELVRRALRELYAPTPTGMPGNDDGGTLSAWWVLGALGLYPAVPGEDVLVMSSPLFRRARLRLRGGALSICAAGASPGRPYIQRARLGPRALGRAWLRFGELERGGKLTVRMGAAPNNGFGSSPEAAPPSYAPGRAEPPAIAGRRAGRPGCGR